MPYWEPILDIVANVKSSKTSALELVQKALSNIEKYKEYNSVITTLESSALGRAEQIDKDIEEHKDPGLLAGVPFLAKDNFLVLGAETTAGTNMLRGFIPPYQATAINKLEAAGAICVGKTNLDAFAHGGSTENSDFGVTLNPIDKTRVSGGSSGGSAAAVALGIVPFALGTDTGGSIRQPSAFCGVVGYKPTYGLVSRSGVVAMGSSLDSIGPIGTRSDDLALVLDVISGRDELDATTIEKNPLGYLGLNSVIKGQRIGVVKEFLGNGVAPDIRKAVDSVLDLLKDKGAQIDEVSLPSTSLALVCYYIICPAEVSSNLSRYDGQRYGYSSNADDLEHSYLNSRAGGFGKEAKRRIMIGNFVLSSGYYDAYYKKAQTVRTKIINEFNQAFMNFDFLVGPVTPITAFKIGSKIDDPVSMYLADEMTVSANLVGIPSVSVPIGVDTDKLPIGFQIMAPQNKDRELLGMVKAMQEEIDVS